MKPTPPQYRPFNPTVSTEKLTAKMEATDRHASYKLLRDVKSAAASDLARGTGPRRNTPKSYHEALDGPAPPEPVASSEQAFDLHSALMSVGTELQQHMDKKATLGTIGVAFHKVAERIKPSTPDI